MDKSKIYLDLSKCTEEERKSLTPILKKEGEHICYPIEKSDNNLLSFSPHCNGWNSFREVYSKQELTYPEFIKLFEGGESKEVLQVENNGWISVDKKLPSIEGEYLIYKEDNPMEVKYYDLKQWGYYHSADEPPTHWMPLPEPPKF